MATSATAHRVVDAPTVELARPSDGTPLYVHLPFCAAKCTYCDFYSVPAAGQDLAGVLASLSTEARLRAPRSPRTLFLGGGTPSLYSAADVRRFLDELDDATGWRASAVEASAECNPESLDEHKAEALLEAGITRLSIGFQSLDAARLALFGRVHSVAQSFAAYAAARRAGATRINIDLIYAAPGQTVQAWRAELDRVLELGPDHLSAYNLTIEPGTALHRRRAEGALQQLDDELELEQFATTRECCRSAGLAPYEISNYARPGEECLHNVAYWENREYVGIGPSAVSKVGLDRFGNARSITAWRTAIAAASAGGSAGEPATSAGDRVAPDWCERPSDLARLGETWWLGLRLASGLSPADARARARVAPSPGPDPAAQLAEELRAMGLLERGDVERDSRAVATARLVGLAAGDPAGDSTGEPTDAAACDSAIRYRLSERGLPLADAVGRRFLALARP